MMQRILARGHQQAPDTLSRSTLVSIGTYAVPFRNTRSHNVRRCVFNFVHLTIRIALRGQGGTMRQVSLFVVTLLFSAATLIAQDFPRVEAFGGYTYVRGGVFSATNLNGWNGDLALNFNKWVGVAADVGGFYGNNKQTINPPVGVPCPPICST